MFKKKGMGWPLLAGTIGTMAADAVAQKRYDP